MIATLLLVATFGALVGPDLDRDARAVEQAIANWDTERAGAVATRMLAQNPESSEANLIVARVRFMEGRYADAMATLGRAETLAIDDTSRAHAREFREFVAPLADLAARFTVEESEHFRVHFVDGPDRVLARRALLVLEGSYGVLGQEFGVRPEQKVRVEIFPDAESFQKASTLTRKEIETSGTIALCKFNRIMMMSPRLVLRGFAWCDTLCHEYVHYVLWRRNGPTIPIWLHEGIAKYEETRWGGNPGSELSPRMQRVLKGAIDADQFVTFDQMHPSFAKLDDPHQVELASAEVLSVVRTVLARGGSESLGRMLDALRDGHSWQQMFEVALAQPFDTFWASWKADVKKQLVDVKGEPVSKNIVQLRDPMTPAAAPEQVAKAAQPETVDPSEDEEHGMGRWVRLGDMLYQRQMYLAAAVEYEKAVVSDSTSHTLLNRLADTYRVGGDAERAVSRYQRSLELEPEYAPTLTSLGLLHQRLGQAVAAIETLERAAAINPYDPRIHEALADTYGGLGREAERQGALGDLLALHGETATPAKEP